MPIPRFIVCILAALALSTSGCFTIIEDGDEDVSEDTSVADTDPDVAEVADEDANDSGDDASDTADTADTTAEPDLCDSPTSRAAIDGVDLSGAIFLGQPALPAVDYPTEPTQVESFLDYREQFAFDADETGRADGSLDAGTFVPSGDNALAWSVQMYFANGGALATIVPTANDVPSDADLAKVTALDGGLLVVPGLGSAAERERRDGFERIEVALNAEENADLFFVGDAPAGATTADLNASSPLPYVGFRDDRAALYVPWLEVTSAANASTSVDIPPAGAVAGIFARTDRDRGIWKSPAGVSADIRGIQGLVQTIDDADLDTWNVAQVNPLRVVDGEPVVWGARTRQANTPEWKYVPIRRLATYIERSILHGTRWAAFKPNDETLWSNLAASTDNFLNGVWRAGGLQGVRAEDAYFVRVDRTTITTADIDAGRAVIELGFAPLKPAEFVILRIEVPAGVCL
ncbi:MAG: phage tail sheath family protein [Myxococcota bacterium]